MYKKGVKSVQFSFHDSHLSIQTNPVMLSSGRSIWSISHREHTSFEYMQEWFGSCLSWSARITGEELLPEEVIDAEEDVIRQAQYEAYTDEYVTLAEKKPLPAKSQLNKLLPSTWWEWINSSWSPSDICGVWPIWGEVPNSISKWSSRDKVDREVLPWDGQSCSRCELHHVPKFSKVLGNCCPWRNPKLGEWVQRMKEKENEACNSCDDTPSTNKAEVYLWSVWSLCCWLCGTLRDHAKKRYQTTEGILVSLHLPPNKSKIHLETAWALETHTFLNAIARFTSIRGVPKEMIIDNGKDLFM